MSKKELKSPDAFQKVGSEAREWLQSRQMLAVAVVGALLVGGGGVALASYVSERGQEKAAKDFGVALKVLDRPVVEAVQSFAPASDLKDPPFKSQREKDEAIKRTLEEFRAQHPGTRAASTAALPMAEAALRLGDNDAAIAAFQEYLKSGRKEEPLHASALEGLGYAYEAKGQLDPALSAFEQLSRESKPEFLSGMGQYHRARILSAQGKQEEAAKVFKEVSSSFPNTAAARMASDRLSLLAAQGVKIPEAPAGAPDAG